MEKITPFAKDLMALTTSSPKAINQTTGDTRQVIDHKRETLHLGDAILPSLGEPVVKADLISILISLFMCR